jgi:2-polyprenyl-6-methoxyphenol hydroxylase-like FAD-dependent oxidoreductase
MARGAWRAAGHAATGGVLVAQRVVIIGAGIGGLATALALKSFGHQILLIERDPPPPDIAPEEAFERWERPGVPQFRHAHILLSRIQTTLRDQHPDLLQQLFDAGLYLSAVEEILPPTHYRGIRPMPGDGDLLHLWGRRATFEYVIRRYVERLPSVRFVHDTRVIGLVTGGDETQLSVRGVEIDDSADKRVVIDADIVVDCSGVRSKLPEWLANTGVKVEVEGHASGFVYACRHYRLNEPEASPPRREGGGNFDYLGYATFYAEHGNYALTFGCPEEEQELAELIKRADGFESLCEQLPVLKHWTSISQPTTKVLGAGRFENRWRRFGQGGGRQLSGLFALGDSQLQTNPMYGRGCASAFVQAEVLAQVLRESSDPATRAQRYYARSHQLLQPYYELSVATDRMYRTRARLRRGLPIPAGERLFNTAYEKAWLPATYTFPLAAREFLKSVQMRPISSLGVRLQMVGLIFIAGVRSLFKQFKLPNVTPPREDFFRRLQLPVADGRSRPASARDPR